MYQDMRNSFTGGSVDVFKSYGENLYHYDVNSLYPYIMKNYKFPVGSPIYFEGNILDERLNYYKPFGIFEAEIITPENLNIPLLQTRFNTSNCIKTISPLGKWTGMYLSDELYKAIELGYKIKIIRGYLFDKMDIYSDFINYFYKIKQENTYDSAQYIISKLIMNRLYGRLGMNPVK
jgi:DNA polymerase type B, organellar and viral